MAPFPCRQAARRLGRVAAVKYNQCFLEGRTRFFSNEGVHILPVNQNHGPHQNFLCSSRGYRPLKSKHTSIYRALQPASRLARILILLALVVTTIAASAQQPQTVDQIRVIGNRRIPKETVLARLFTHVGDTYDPVSVERDFNSLWNTGYFENLRIEREDSEKGVILNVYVQEKPTIREINYKGLNVVSQSDVLDRFKKEKVGLSQESQYDPTKVKKAGSTVPIKIELCDAAGNDLSSGAIAVHADLITPGGVAPVSSSNPGNFFTFDATLGTSGGYIYNEQTKGLAPGTYMLHFSAAGDPTDHTAVFMLS